MALAYLDDAGLASETDWPAQCGVPSHLASSVAPLLVAMRRGLNAPFSSSAGRLFDAVAALAGVRAVGQFEGQAAMELEALSAAAVTAEPYPYAVASGVPMELDLRPMIRALHAERCAGAPASRIGARFHATVATMFSEAVLQIARAERLSTVVLSGGCFQNATLAALCQARLSTELRVLRPARFPCNDGGIALGQAAVAAARRRT
jgi:hydrogenase maturation protein HypF